MEIIFLFRKEKSESLPIMVKHRSKRPRNRRRNFCPYGRKNCAYRRKNRMAFNEEKIGFSRFEVTQNDYLNKPRGKYSHYYTHSQKITNTSKDIKGVSSAI